VALVAILDADKEGFLRSERAFIQIAGRAARNAAGRVILYADRITQSMQKLIDETERRRAKQIAYNQQHGIVPKTIQKNIHEILSQPTIIPEKLADPYEKDIHKEPKLADPILASMNKEQLKAAIAATRKQMESAAKELDFVAAARFRDEMFALERLLSKKN
jgi:excinuclease ABC subunit B